jgi:hypothetical protein
MGNGNITPVKYGLSSYELFLSSIKDIENINYEFNIFLEDFIVND